MGDVFEPLRKFRMAGLNEPEKMPFIVDQVVGQISDRIRFYAGLTDNDEVIVHLRCRTGRITKGNVDAFLRHWGIADAAVGDIKSVGSPAVTVVLCKEEIEKMITPQIDSRGVPAALCQCDICGRESQERAKPERSRGAGAKIASEGQVIRRLQGKGWTYLQKTLRCPFCEDERRKEEPKPQIEEPKTMAVVATSAPVFEIAEPTREQKRQIVALIDSVYDTERQRYAGGETDRSVADTLGPWCKIDWVAQQREELYGPAGNSEELAEITAAMSVLKIEIDALVASLGQLQARVEALS